MEMKPENHYSSDHKGGDFHSVLGANSSYLDIYLPVAKRQTVVQGFRFLRMKSNKSVSETPHAVGGKELACQTQGNIDVKSSKTAKSIRTL